MRDINNKELYEISGGENIYYDYGKDVGYKVGKTVKSYISLFTTKDMLKRIATLWCQIDYLEKWDHKGKI